MSKAEPFLITVLPIDIDVDLLVSDCLQIVDRYKMDNQAKNLREAYSIVLTQNPDVEETHGNIVSYKDIHNTQYFDRYNQAILQPAYDDTSLKALVMQLPFPFSIIRLSVLPPSTIIAMHTDAACHAQLAITTNEDCFVAARSGAMEHVAVDSKLYVFSTTLAHTAFNASNEDRVHLSISIFDHDYVKLLRSAG